MQVHNLLFHMNHRTKLNLLEHKAALKQTLTKNIMPSSSSTQMQQQLCAEPLHTALICLMGQISRCLYEVQQEVEMLHDSTAAISPSTASIHIQLLQSNKGTHLALPYLDSIYLGD